MKKYLSMLLMMLLCWPLASSADEVVTIGANTTTTNVGPIGSYTYSWVEEIYPGSAFEGKSGFIKKIAYNVATASPDQVFANLIVYMAEIDDAAHASTTSWVPASELTEVYNHTDVAYGTTTGWNEIVLDTPFSFSGTKNLAIVIAHKGTNALRFYQTATTGACLYRRDNANSAFMSHPEGNAGTVSTVRPNIQITLGDGELTIDGSSFTDPAPLMASYTTSTTPLRSNQGSGYTETRYPANVFGGLTNIAIKSVAFNVTTAGGVSSKYGTLQIWMGEANEALSTGFTPQSDLTLVYEGTDVPYATVSGWNDSIVLDTPFNYSGTKALVLVVAHQGAGSTAVRYNAARFGDNGYCRYNQGSMAYPTDAGSVSCYIAHMKLTYGPGSGEGCPKVESVSVDEVAATTATISWESEASSWDVYVTSGAAPGDDTTPTATGIEAKTYTFTGLEAVTSYKAYVRSNCGDGEVSAWKDAQFFTSPDFQGEGTAENPYQIASSEDFAMLNAAMNGGWATAGRHFQLTATAELSTPIGTTTAAFRGEFDGNGNTVALDIVDNSFAGYKAMFAVVGDGANIHDLTVSGHVASAARYGAGIVAFVADGNVTVENCVNQAIVSGRYFYVGGIVGYNAGASMHILNCINEGVITIDGYDFCGGIVGNVGAAGVVDNCFNKGNVSARVYVGGIAGDCEMGGIVRNSGNTGDVTSTGVDSDYNYVAGIVGRNNKGYVENNYNLGIVTGTKGYIGGIVGANQFQGTNGMVANCYNAGAIAAPDTQFSGAVAGFNAGFSGYGSANIHNSYYLNSTCEVAYGSASTGVDGIVNVTSFAQESYNSTLAEEIEGTTDMVAALNAWIGENTQYNTWYVDYVGDNQFFPGFVETEPPTPAETEIVTGEEQPGYTSNAPFYNNAAYSYDETIYLSSLFEEVGNGTITKIAYDVATAREGNTFEQLKIYMGETDATRYSSTSAWTPQTDLTLVYDGTDVAFGRTTGWNEIELDEPFEYSGEHNLVVVVAKQCLDYDGSLNYYYNMATNSTLYRTGRSASYMNYTTLAGTRASYRALAKITFGQPSNCPKVEELAVSDVTSSSAVLNWTSEGEAWDVYVTSEGDVPTAETTPTANVEETSYTATGLAALTSYDAYVRTNCGTETSKWVAVSFTTEPDFEGEGTAENPYQISNATDLVTLSNALGMGWETENTYFKVMNDIEDVTTVIGSNSASFKGNFDGDSHVITVAIEGTSYVGLFASISNGGSIHDVIVNGTVSATGDFVGGVAASIGTGSMVDNCVNNASVIGRAYVGGIAGDCAAGAILRNSANMASVESTGVASSYDYNYVAGIVGRNDKGYVENNYNLGTVTGTKGYIGGIVGANQFQGTNGMVANCYNAGAIAAPDTQYSGAVAGFNAGFSGYGSANIHNSYYLNSTCEVAYGSASTGVDGVVNVTSFAQESYNSTLAEEIEGTTDMVAALNAWIGENTQYNTWYVGTDATNGYPSFIPCYVINLTASIDDAGTLVGAGAYAPNAEVAVEATAAEGYAFVCWKENEEIVSTSSEYTFTATADRDLVAVFMENQAGEQVVEIGIGASSDSNLPISNNYRYAWSETLYKSTSFETGGAITKIAYNVKMADADPTHTYAQFKVYMGESDLTQHTGSAYSSNAWAPMSDLTLVFSATDFAYGTEKGWNEIVLDTPFNYSAEKSLVIVIAHEGTNGATFMNSNLSATKASLYRRSDSDASFASHPGTVNGTYVSKYADIQITIQGSSVPAIDALTLGEVTSSSATINWESEGQMFDVYVNNGTESSEIATVLSKTYTFEGLEAGTSYTAYVRANCGEAGQGAWSQVSFFTTPDFEGEGTEENPYKIYSATDLVTLSNALGMGWETKNTYFIVMNDIEGVNSVIGSNTASFKGNFNGDRHVITVDITGTSYVGLFASISNGGYIHDVIVNGTVSATGDYVGGIVASVGASPASVIDCINNASVTGRSYVGGIAGDVAADASVASCANKGEIFSIGTASSYDYNYVGGIVGRNNVGYVTNCYNLGTVIGTKGYIGGIVGANQFQGSNGMVANCYNAGAIQGPDSQYSGAIVGYNGGFSGYGSANIHNCYYLQGSYEVAYGSASGGTDGIVEVTSFTQEGTVCTLDNVVYVVDGQPGTTDLLTALNVWATQYYADAWYADEIGDNQQLPTLWVTVAPFTFLGTVDFNWNNAANWSTNEVPGATDNAIIMAPCGLEGEAEVAKLTFAKDMVGMMLQPGAVLKADTIEAFSSIQLVIFEGAQVINSNAGVQAMFFKQIKGFTGDKDNWYLMASPFMNPECDTLTANVYDLYTFDQSEDKEWINQHDNAQIAHQVGYLYANSEDMELVFTGEIAVEAEPVELAYTEGAEFAGFNLVGNPFTCNAYINRSFLRMNEDGTELVPGTGAIGVSESVFVEAAAAGETVTFTKEETVARGLSVEVAKGASKDRAIISFAGQGLHKMMLNEDNTKVYVPQDNKRLAVAVAEDMSGEMPVNFKAAENGTYTISINAENVNANYLHLVDNMTGADVDLKSAPSYTFEARTTDYASRFRIIFSASNADDNNAESETFAYMINGNLVIDNAGEATLQIVDMLGRVVSTETFVGNYNKTLNLKAGVYVVRMNDKTQKVVVD